MCDKQACRSFVESVSGVGLVLKERPEYHRTKTGINCYENRQILPIGSCPRFGGDPGAGSISAEPPGPFLPSLMREGLLPMHHEDRTALLAWVQAKQAHEVWLRKFSAIVPVS